MSSVALDSKINLQMNHIYLDLLIRMQQMHPDSSQKTIQIGEILGAEKLPISRSKKELPWPGHISPFELLTRGVLLDI